jgi:hypothetical protein
VRGLEALGAHHNYRRSDLFLLRLWAEVADDGSKMLKLHGKLQRVVNGESHRFCGWQGLLDLLMTMVSEESKQPADPAQEEDGR